MHKNAGFTLIELLVVVLIIGILASVALPQYQVAVEKSRAGSLMPNLRTIKNALEVYRLANGEYPPDRIGGLDISLPGCTEDEAGGSTVVKIPIIIMKAARLKQMIMWTQRQLLMGNLIRSI